MSFNVLIVAKCIVNIGVNYNEETGDFVLIVAKCIVNINTLICYSTITQCINSSKVYCKYI